MSARGGGLAGRGLAGLLPLGLCRSIRALGFGWLRPSRDQFDDYELGGITDPAAGLDQPRIAALPVLKPPGHITEQLADRFLAAKKAERPAARGQVALFAERDHPVGEAAELLRLRLGGFDALMLDERSHQAPEERPTVLGVTSELTAFFAVTHSNLYSVRVPCPAGNESTFMPRCRPISARISLISFRDFLPKFLVFNISISLFCTRSAMVLML